MDDRERRGEGRSAPGGMRHGELDELENQFDRDQLRRKREELASRRISSLTERERDERWPIG